MALFRSSLVSSLSGSVGGTVYSRNRSGAYSRNRTIPSQPNSEAQQFIRGKLLDVAGYYDGLTAQQRLLWDQFASGYPMKNRLGEDRFRTGREVCAHLNFWKALSGDAPLISVPPSYQSGGNPITMINPVNQFVDAYSDTQEIEWTSHNTLFGYCFAFISAGLSPGQNSVKQPLRYWGWGFVDDTVNVLINQRPSFSRDLTFPMKFVVRLVFQDSLGWLSQDWVRIIGTSN